MRIVKIIALTAIAIFIGTAAVNAADTVKDGKTLYLGEKYKCFSCHGEKGEGGKGPSFKGVGKKHTAPEMMKLAAHNCPPTGACSPKDISALVDFIRTL